MELSTMELLQHAMCFFQALCFIVSCHASISLPENSVPFQDKVNKKRVSVVCWLGTLDLDPVVTQTCWFTVDSNPISAQCRVHINLYVIGRWTHDFCFCG